MTDSGWSLSSGTVATGEAIDSVTVTGSQTVVGASDNVASAAVIKDGSEDVTSNYSISYVKGTLTVDAATGQDWILPITAEYMIRKPTALR